MVLNSGLAASDLGFTRGRHDKTRTSAPADSDPEWRRPARQRACDVV